MGRQQKNNIISNGAIILTTVSIVCCLIGFAGGFLYNDAIIFKWMAGCGIILGVILYAVYVHYKPDTKLSDTNKIIRIICLILVSFAIVIFTAFMTALITLTFLNIFPK